MMAASSVPKYCFQWLEIYVDFFDMERGARQFALRDIGEHSSFSKHLSTCQCADGTDIAIMIALKPGDFSFRCLFPVFPATPETGAFFYPTAERFGFKLRLVKTTCSRYRYNYKIIMSDVWVGGNFVSLLISHTFEISPFKSPDKGQWCVTCLSEVQMYPQRHGAWRVEHSAR